MKFKFQCKFQFNSIKILHCTVKKDHNSDMLYCSNPRCILSWINTFYVEFHCFLIPHSALIHFTEPSVAAKLEGEAFEMTKMNLVRPELIISHLQALCLAEQVFPSAELITKVVNHCRGNIRQSILQLQFILEQWKDPSYKLMKPKLECAKLEETEQEDKTDGLLVRQGDDKVQEDKTDEVEVVEIRPIKVAAVDKSEATDSIQTSKAQKDVTEECENCVKEDVCFEDKSKIVTDIEKKSKDGEVSESNIAKVTGSSAVDSLPDVVAKSELGSETKEETDLLVTVLEDEECGIIEEDRSCIFEMEKASNSLFP